MKKLSTLSFLCILLLSTACGEKPEEQQRIALEDIEGKTLYELRLMRNEIFARHGYIFKSKDLQRYFFDKEWYKPLHADVNHLLTETDKTNVALIQQMEALVKQAREESEKRIRKKTIRIYADIKGSKQLDGFNLTVVSIFKLPIDGTLREDSSYYNQGHYLVSSKTDLKTLDINDIGIEEYKAKWTSFIELINPCSEISADQLQFLEANFFDKDEKSLRFLFPECSDYTTNIFIAWKDGQLTEKFSADVHWKKEVNFKQENDSIFSAIADGRDELVSNFNSDYRYEYNNKTNELAYIEPSVQVISWRSQTLIDFVAYETKEAASVQDASQIKFRIKAGEYIYLYTYYRDIGAVYITKGDSTGYLNSSNINHNTVTGNGAG